MGLAAQKVFVKVFVKAFMTVFATVFIYLKTLVRLCGPQHIQNYTKNSKWEISNKYFDVFGLLSSLRACNVSVVASGAFFHVGKSIC